ncbi:unnamed protein product [Fraxinus pennsylvanica]|uniref:Protein kinase domain-containing protein n=1 Tax=Fraxinus pennsylvanica TaxID=56036 RepID=A0AAD1ZW66_9LAMI|nr:unnamed protein product [Fraxinus pennsylvanica]
MSERCQLVAIKRLIRETPTNKAEDSLSELGVLEYVDHPNIANVIGYGIEGGMHLVLPLSINGSLSSITDFGLAKWIPDEWTQLTVSELEGTLGYLPPEFFMYGIVDEKTDVYAFGVLLLELITGRPAIDDSHQGLVMWAKPMLISKNYSELVDSSLGDAYDSEQMKRMVMVASICIHQSSTERPQMSQASVPFNKCLL